jgi:hypothetical protein
VKTANGIVKDLDADGFLDIVVASPLNACVAFFKGQKDLTFGQPVYFQESADVYAVASGDFNEDGLEDIVYATNSFTGSTNKTVLLLAKSSGGFENPTVIDTSPSYALTVGDFTGDGRPDIVSSSYIYVNIGNAKFLSRNLVTPIIGIYQDLGLFDGNSSLDLVINDGSSVYVGLNDGNGNFSVFNKIQTKPVSKPKVVNYDSDKLADIVSLSGSNSIVILRNKGNGTFDETNVNLSEGGVFGSADLADFDNDGKPEIVTGLSIGSGSSVTLGVGVFVLKADGRFDLVHKLSLATSLFSAGVPDLVQIIDIDKDNKKDIFVYKLNAEPLVILPNDLVVEPKNSPSINISNKSNSTATISLGKGDGIGRICIIRETSSARALPSDGVFYSANLVLGVGAQIGVSNFVLLRSNETSFVASNLKEGQSYIVDAYEYNINSKNTIINYLTSISASVTFTTKKTQTISVSNVGSKTVGDADFILDAKATSTLPVAVEFVFGGITLQNLSVKILNPGPVKLKFLQGGSDDFMPAPSLEVTFCVNPPKPIVSTVSSAPGEYTLSSSSDFNNNWLLNGNAIPFATNKTFIPKENGVYSVKIDFDGCSSTSDPTANLITGVEPSDDLAIYPNPASERLNIRLNLNGTLVNEVHFFDGMGRSLLISKAKYGDFISADVADLSIGVYFAALFYGNSVRTYKFIKN